MGKPSNEELLAERKSIAEILNEIPGASNEEKAKWLIGDWKQRQESPPSSPQYDALVRENKSLVNQLQYLSESRHKTDMPGYVPAKEPAMAPDMGDLTPVWVRWFAANNPKDAVIERYIGREEHLPEDVRKEVYGN